MKKLPDTKALRELEKVRWSEKGFSCNNKIYVTYARSFKKMALDPKEGDIEAFVGLLDADMDAGGKSCINCKWNRTNSPEFKRVKCCTTFPLTVRHQEYGTPIQVTVVTYCSNWEKFNGVKPKRKYGMRKIFTLAMLDSLISAYYGVGKKK